MKSFVLFALGALSAFSQPFTAGVKLGIPVTNYLGSVNSDNVTFPSYTNRYLGGPTVELRLPFGLGIEVDALYRHYYWQTAGSLTLPSGIVTLSSRGKTNDWEFPLLAKYRLPIKLVRPFLDAGVSFATLQGYKQTETVVSPIPIAAPANLNQPAHNTVKGAVIGGGLEIKAPYVHLSPELRYTHWGSQHFVPNSDVPSQFPIHSGLGISSNQDQVEILMGVTF